MGDKIVISLVLLISTMLTTVVESQTCKLQKFSKASATFSLCEDLPHLSSQLHYTYNATNSSLSIAFVATPSKPGGWVSWAINPTARGMVGSQAFVAHEDNGSLTVKTLNISGYREFHPGKLAFDFWDLAAEKSGGVNGSITIFASLKVLGNESVVNQVWQVGPGVGADGRIQAHEFSGESLKSNSSLSLTGGSVDGPAGAPTAGSTPVPAGTPKSGSVKRRADHLGLGLGLLIGLMGLLLLF